MKKPKRRHKGGRQPMEFILLRVALNAENGYWNCAMYQIDDYTKLPHELRRGNDYDEESSWI